MSGGGGKPGFTAKVTAVSVGATEVAFRFKDDETSYFEVGHEYVVFFQPTPPEQPASGEGEQGSS